MTKVAVAMSGGVDSGVAAGLLVKRGYECAGFHMRLWHEEQGNFENKCCSTESLEAARKTCHKLGIPFYPIDFSGIFKKKVVDYFLQEYAAGLTPNPCVMCNKYVKFGQLLDYVRKLGFDYLATGHYARISNPHRRCLLTGVDKAKDQTYFLYNLTQRQLAHILFPVGEYTKKQVIAMAKNGPPAGGLPVAERPESQEICFFPESDYRPFLKRQIREKIIPGEVVDTKGKVIGKHQGIPLYTIGQRHGFEIRIKERESERVKKGIIPPFYVIGKDSKKNQLIVGFGKEAERKKFWVRDVNWINPLAIEQLSNEAIKCQVRIRHQGELLKCKIKNVKLKMTKVVLDEPERGIAPGQAAVFYKRVKEQESGRAGEDYEVLGGGIIAIDKN